MPGPAGTYGSHAGPCLICESANYNNAMLTALASDKKLDGGLRTRLASFDS